MILRATISIDVETAFRVGSVQCEFFPSASLSEHLYRVLRSRKTTRNQLLQQLNIRKKGKRL